MIEKTLLIIPTFNERDNIVPLLKSIRRHFETGAVLFIDDNSPDGTADVIQTLCNDDKYVFLKVRAGKNGLADACLAAYQWALEHDYEYVIQLDADGSHDAAFLPALLAVPDGELVIGSRYCFGSQAQYSFKLFLSRVANIYARTILGLPVADVTSGYRRLSRLLLIEICQRGLRSQGFVFQVEVAAIAHQQGHLLKELPVVYKARWSGSSKQSIKLWVEGLWRVLSLRRPCK